MQDTFAWLLKKKKEISIFVVKSHQTVLLYSSNHIILGIRGWFQGEGRWGW